MKRFAWDGSYTVEAAFIVPMVLGIFYAWMFQLFYLRDQVVESGMLSEAVIRSGTKSEVKTEDEPKIKLETETKARPMDKTKIKLESDVDQEAIQKALWLSRIELYKEAGNSIETNYQIRASAGWHIPVMLQFLREKYHYNEKMGIYKLQPETMVRLRKQKDGTKDPVE